MHHRLVLDTFFMPDKLQASRKRIYLFQTYAPNIAWVYSNQIRSNTHEFCLFLWIFKQFGYIESDDHFNTQNHPSKLGISSHCSSIYPSPPQSPSATAPPQIGAPSSIKSQREVHSHSASLHAHTLCRAIQGIQKRLMREQAPDEPLFLIHLKYYQVAVSGYLFIAFLLAHALQV